MEDACRDRCRDKKSTASCLSKQFPDGVEALCRSVAYQGCRRADRGARPDSIGCVQGPGHCTSCKVSVDCRPTARPGRAVELAGSTADFRAGVLLNSRTTFLVSNFLAENFISFIQPDARSGTGDRLLAM